MRSAKIMGAIAVALSLTACSSPDTAPARAQADAPGRVALTQEVVLVQLTGLT